jgi:hypothetical protein
MPTKASQPWSCFQGDQHMGQTNSNHRNDGVVFVCPFLLCRRKRRNKVSDILMWENPYGMTSYKRSKKVKRHRNPASSAVATTKKMFMGIDLKDAVSAGAGLIATTMVPVMFTSVTNKYAKLGVSIAVAVASGYVGKVAGGAEAGKAALLGGIAGVVVQSMKVFVPSFVIGSPGVRKLSAPSASNIASSLGRYPAPAYADEFNGVKLD